MATRVTHTILDHDDPENPGSVVTLGDVLTDVRVKVVGNNDSASYNFGEFYLDNDCTGANAAQGMMNRMVPEDTADDADEVPITEALTATLARASIGTPGLTIGTDPATGAIWRWGTFQFCANVTANTEAQDRYQRIQTWTTP